jgi:exopolyphosphatase/guanosine-5'-triphosphate,3'-diphosphate pyrophosphatase
MRAETTGFLETIAQKPRGRLNSPDRPMTSPRTHFELGAPSPIPPAMAALDLGTNNCRLLVARPCGDNLVIVDSFSRIVRLGEAVARTGRLSEAAIARTVGALRVCARIVARHEVGAIRCVATEACRRAQNGAEFLGRVRRITGLRFEILPHEDEARLALLGCLPLIDPAAEHVLLIDIGGGSTELLWLDRSQTAGQAVVRCNRSIAAGVVALSEAFAAEPDPSTFEAMVRHVEGLLAPIEAQHAISRHLASGRSQMLGTSGTVTTLAAMHLDLLRYDRRQIDGLVLEAGAVGAVSTRLRRMTNAERAAHPCIGPGRADLVVAGCAILEAVWRSWPTDQLRVADRGLREGILQGLMGRSLAQALTGPGATASLPEGLPIAAASVPPIGPTAA